MMTNVMLTVSGISISVIWWHIVLSLSQGMNECECEPPGMSSEYVLPKMIWSWIVGHGTTMHAVLVINISGVYWE